MKNHSKHKIELWNGEFCEVDLINPVARLSNNPILSAEDINKVWRDPAHQVVTVHNAGATLVGRDTVLLFRSHLRCGISVLGLAKSKNGIDSWTIHDEPVFKPATTHDDFSDVAIRDQIIKNESGGVEDPRISKIKDEYAITYSAYHSEFKDRVRVHLATTKDFITYRRYGPVLERDMRNVVIFPGKINHSFMALFRPNDHPSDITGGKYTEILLGVSNNWKNNIWKLENKPIMKTGHGPSAFSDKIGPGAPPLKTNRGWINIFHGVRKTMDGNPYVLGVAVHDLSNPKKIKISSIPILFPSSVDCRVKDDEYVHVPNVVFTCGALRRDNGIIYIYYGGNDTVLNVGITHEDILFNLCENFGQDPLTGKLNYKI
jgi:predicted GH43/DUF377 family glycosyl hydrolase